MNFPTYTRTKAEALNLAAAIFPDERTALDALRQAIPDCKHPRYHLTQTATDTLRAVFDWLFDDRTRIYKRARWHLFYSLAHRLIDQIDANARAKIIDLYAEDHARDWQRRVAAWTMTGDGAGI